MPAANARKLRHHPATKIEKRLATYAAAASAAGVSALALAQPAEAKVVYTPANTPIKFASNMKLDLNHDGIPDFGFGSGGLGHFINEWVGPLRFNKVFGGYSASALSSGVTVGANGKAVGHIALMEQLFTNSFGTNYFGPWVGAHNKYLGLAFQIHGEVHFGWARINFPAFGDATLTGYAFETIPGKAIVTGDTGQTTEAAMDAGTLGGLALGARERNVWRRQDGAE